MTVVVFYTVGTSELLLDGALIPPAYQRQKGEDIKLNFDQYAPRLNAQLMEPCLHYILERHQHVHRMVLFGTDQAEDVAERGRDTCYVAEVLKKVVACHFPPPSTANPRLRGVVEAKVQSIREDPSDYEAMYRWFARYLGRSQPGDVVYLCTTGGTPAMTQGLLLQGMLCFRERCHVLYVSKTGTEAEERRFPALFLRDLRTERLHNALERWDFAGACQLLAYEEDWKHPFARYAAFRLRYDFKQARIALDAAVERANGEARHQLRAIRDGLLKEIQVASEGDFVARVPALVEELFYNARVAWGQERYDDFLVRLVRFEEASARYLVETYLKLPTDEREKKREFLAAVEANPDLVRYLETARSGDGPLDYRRMTIPTFLALILYGAGGGVAPGGLPLVASQEQERLGQLQQLLSRQDRLRTWRNDFMHNLGGASKDELLSVYQEGQSSDSSGPLADMEQVVTLLGRPTDRDPYRQATKVLLKAL